MQSAVRDSALRPARPTVVLLLQGNHGDQPARQDAWNHARSDGLGSAHAEPLRKDGTPANKRQALVDRFQEDETVRVFLANIIAGGIGLNLTAASQVVFNDLDWVPASHWQAEDRAYRIGQTRTVNVTYLVGTGTVDDFVQAVLETKRALVMPSWRARRRATSRRRAASSRRVAAPARFAPAPDLRRVFFEECGFLRLTLNRISDEIRPVS